MALTAGERSALWRKRQREDPGKHEDYKRKERERYKRRKDLGQLKSVKDMSNREHRKTKRQWRANQQNKRERERKVLKVLQNTLSPPTSPEHAGDKVPVIAEVQDGRKVKGRKKVRKDRAKCYRDVFKLRVKLDKMRRLKNKYKQRYYRVKPRQKKKQDENVAHNVKVYATIVNGLKEKYKKSNNLKEKRLIRDLIFRENMLKKYKLCSYASRLTGINMHSRDKKAKRCTKTKARIALQEVVIDFFDRDDNSRIKAGKKSTITKNQVKKQIRLLNEPLNVLHKKFVYELKSKLSYSTFCKLKPFWVMKASERDRDTCLCKLHENPKFKINKLFAEKVISTSDVGILLGCINCNTKNQTCMYRQCTTCKDKQIQANDGINAGKIIEWYAWTSKIVTREKVNGNGETIQTKHTMTVKEKQSGTIENALDDLNSELQRLSRHVYNINHQYIAMRQLRNNLKQDSVIIHIDFSENYCCKYSSEIQSTHFGASKRQISIHTGVAYTHNQTISFATVSDCLKHGPGAIWAHMDPVLTYVKQLSDSALQTVHFISDGPTTQYRSKTNFYLFSKKIYEYGFKSGTWNFWESGHGKGAPDGIGAVVKRQSDDLVRTRQRDVMQASDIVEGMYTNQCLTLYCSSIIFTYL